MKKILLIAIMAIVTTGAFASVNKGKTTVTKSTKKTAKSKALECHAYQVKYYHNAGCDNSWYNVDWVDTINVTCDANGNEHIEKWHWTQNPAVLCSPKTH